MWIARFKLKDDEDICSPLCVKHSIDILGVPLSHFVKDNKINTIVGGIISGSEQNKKRFIKDLKNDKRVKKVEQHLDFILIYAQHPLSRETTAELKIFYNPQYIQAKPITISKDGWEYWEVACLEREELNKLVQAAKKYYHGKLFSIKEEKLRRITSLELAPSLTDKQFESVKLAFKEGYYKYPRTQTIAKLAQLTKKSYSTFQEHLSKAENRIIDYFLKYR